MSFYVIRNPTGQLVGIKLLTKVQVYTLRSRGWSIVPVRKSER